MEKKTLGKGLADEGGCTEKNEKDGNRKWIDNGYTCANFIFHASLYHIWNIIYL